MTTRSADGKRIAKGGAELAVTAVPGGGAAKPVAAEWADLGDGTYSCRFAPLAPDSYDVHVKVNSEPLKDTPRRVTISATKLVGKDAHGPKCKCKPLWSGRPVEGEELQYLLSTFSKDDRQIGARGHACLYACLWCGRHACRYTCLCTCLYTCLCSGVGGAKVEARLALKGGKPSSAKVETLFYL